MKNNIGTCQIDNKLGRTTFSPWSIIYIVHVQWITHSYINLLKFHTIKKSSPNSLVGNIGVFKLGLGPKSTFLGVRGYRGAI